MQWSEAQQKVISARDANLLVSAAAGSGKTAVLVERLVQRISDETDPCGLEELLVMTFTRAAAGEMRERVGKALRDRLAADPDNAHLKEQRIRLPRAQISTIHSVCQTLVHQYYQELDIDPSFRIGDGGELKLQQEDVLQKLLEEQYAEGRTEFLRFAESFQRRSSDQRLSGLIQKVYTYAESLPWPEDFLEEQLKRAEQECSLTEEELDQASWMTALSEEVAAEAGERLELYKAAREACLMDQGPIPYLASIEADMAALRALQETTGYAAQYALVKNWAFPRLGTATAKKYDAGLINFVKSIREGCKKYIKELQNGLLILPPELMAETIRGSAAVEKELLGLTMEFSRRFAETKRDKNVLDFGDLEHFALRLLYRREEDGTRSFSPLADALAGQLKEIMIDEYQDSSGVQEALLKALSAERFGRPDLFMVGDVKQSIYRFRQAKPALFIEKYKSYQETGTNRRIELNLNFRSRREVLCSVNRVFDSLMREDFGGVDYDADARLYPGAAFPETGTALPEAGTAFPEVSREAEAGELPEHGAELPEMTSHSQDTAAIPNPYQTELLLLDLPSEKEEDVTGEMLEYSMIAKRIHQLLGSDGSAPLQVVDKATGALRDVRCRDIVVLMRAVKGGHAELLADTLMQNRIPSYFQHSTGYFTATEVEVVLNYLRIIDNPHQDYALVSVLRSPMVGLSDEELAKIRIASPEGDYYDAVRAAENMPSLSAFLRQLQDYRAIANVISVHMLLQKIYTETGYYDTVSAMPLGKVRRKNLDKLLEKAESFGGGMYHGLFNFVRNIENLQKYETDYGEAGTLTANDDVVRIMTIHGSKGLEYPVVFLARAANGSSGREEEGGIVLDEKLGVAGEYIDLATRVRYPGTKRSLIRRHTSREEADESLRLLYVAMTRAREKLIITGAGSKMEERVQNYLDQGRIWREMQTPAITISEALPEDSDGRLQNTEKADSQGKLPRAIIAARTNHLDWILLSAGSSSDFAINIEHVDAPGQMNMAADVTQISTIAENAQIDTTVETASDQSMDVVSTENPGADSLAAESLKLENPAADTPAAVAPTVDAPTTNASEESAEALYRALTGLDLNHVQDPETARSIEAALEAVYPYEEETRLKPKLSVSELKHQAIEEQLHDPNPDQTSESEMEQNRAQIPESEMGLNQDRMTGYLQYYLDLDDGSADEMHYEKLAGEQAETEVRQSAGGGGARKGTAFHRAMQLLPLKAWNGDDTANKEADHKGPQSNEEAAQQLLEAVLADPRFGEDLRKLLDQRAVLDFLRTDLAQHMREAAVRGCLFREQHFMIGLPARELDPDQDSDEMQLLQGIIDAYIEEEDGSITLIDYKTDRVWAANGLTAEQILADRYRLQLTLYARALQQLTGKKVGHSIIYSTSLGKTIEVE